MSEEQPEGPGSGVPVVRHFIACERINRSLDGKQYTLVNLIHTIHLPPRATYPYVQPEMWLFVHLTDGRGVHSFEVQLFRLSNEEIEVRTWDAIQRDLGQDPLQMYFLPFRVRNASFELPGLYEFRLLCDGRLIAREPILGEEAS